LKNKIPVIIRENSAKSADKNLVLILHISLPGHMPRYAPALLRQQHLPLPTIPDAPGVLEQSVGLQSLGQPEKFIPLRVVQGQEEFLAVQNEGIGLAGVVAVRECATVQVGGPGAEQGIIWIG
jgi:hypothetical protein